MSKSTASLTETDALFDVDAGEIEAPNRFYENLISTPREAKAVLDAAVAKHGPEVLEAIPPVVIAADLDPRFDPDSEETLLEQSVEITPTVNPLFDAVMIANGAKRLSERSYSVSLSEKTGNQQQVLRILRALPVVGVVTDKSEVTAIHKRGKGGRNANALSHCHTLEQMIRQSSLFQGEPPRRYDYQAQTWTGARISDAIEAGEDALQSLTEERSNYYIFERGQAPNTQTRAYEHQFVSCIIGPEGQLFIKVMTSWVPHRGFAYRTKIEQEQDGYEFDPNTGRREPKFKEVEREILIPHKGIYFYEGAPNLHLMKKDGVSDPATVTPAEAVAMIEVAREWGFIVEDRGGIDRLAQRIENIALVERQPASPGLARLIVGSGVKLGQKLEDRVAPLGEVEDSKVRALNLSAEEAASAVRSISRTSKGTEIVFDPRIADVIRMAKAEPIRNRKDGECAHPLRDDQEECVALHKATKIGYLNAYEVGLGKGHPASTRVLTPQGWTTMGNLRVGDAVIGSDGRPTEVTGVFPRGELDVYRVTFSDGASVLCDAEHLWNVRPTSHSRANPRNWQTRDVADLAQNLRWKNGAKRWSIPMVAPVEFQHQAELPVDPYVLGALLGDGGLTGRTVKITPGDKEIIDEIAQHLPPAVHLSILDERGSSTTWGILGDGHGPGVNAVLNALRDLDLMGCYSHEKFIPAIYLTASIADRIALLQGLLDTDGYIAKTDNHVEFSSSSEMLCRDLKELVETLGGTAVIQSKPKPTYKHNGEERVGRPHWRVTIRLPHGIQPFRIKRKLDRYSPTKYESRRMLESITPAGRDQVICIQVAAEDRLYVTEHCLVTHNTVTTAQAQRDLSREESGFRALIVVEASMRTQWLGELNLWFPEAHVAAFSAAEVKKNLDAFMDKAGDDPAILLVSREVMTKCADEIAERSAKDGYWNEIVIDEAAFLDNVGSKRTKALWTLRPFFGRAVALTGTPMDQSIDSKGRIIAYVRNEPKIFHGNRLSKRFDMSKPEDVTAMVEAIGPVVFRRTQAEIGGLPPIDTQLLKLDPEPCEVKLAEGATTELRRILSAVNEKAALAEALPEDDPRRVQVMDELKKVRGAVLGGVTLTRQAACDPAALLGSDSAGVQLLEAADLIRPAVKKGGTKRKVICQQVEDMAKSGEAILIFTDFSSVAYTLRDDLKARGVKVGTFTGDDSSKARDKAKADFMSGDLDVLILTAAGRQGHNLQRATVVIQYDLPWMPSQIVQRVGRARRFGSTAEHIRVIVPVMVGTIEERVASVLVPRAMEAMIALDAHRGVDVAETSTGMAVSGLTEAVPEDKRNDKKGLFAAALELLKMDKEPQAAAA